jgi:RNA polymerase sigma factor (TIGR02999 family)
MYEPCKVLYFAAFSVFVIDTRVNMTRSTPTRLEVTQLLIDWSKGSQDAFKQLYPLVYEELRRLAHRYMAKERRGHTLQTTAVVHEAYLRLIDQKHVQWQNRVHFFAIASQMMRRILITHAQSHAYAKRGGGALKVSLDEAAVLSQERASDLIALDEALKGLTAIDPRRSQVVELRFFGGLSNEEIAEVLNISTNTVTRDWSVAKAWLHREVSKEQEGES